MSQSPISVIHSIFNGADLLEQVCINYPINQAIACKLYKRGLNDTYLVLDETDQYILRVYRSNWRSLAAINWELEILEFLRQHQQPIAYPLCRYDGKFLSEVIAPEGKRFAALFMYAQGQAVNQKLDVVQSYILGRTLAHIHNCLDKFASRWKRVPKERNLNASYLLDWSLTGIGQLYGDRTEEMKYLKHICVNLKRQIKSINLSAIAPEYGVCVGDVHGGNAHFTEDNQVTLLDFDQCGYGWRVFDIAKFWQVAMKIQIGAEVKNCFVDGYQDVRELSEGEIAALPLLIKVAHIWVMGINTHAVGEVIPYGYFDDDWLDQKLALLDNWE